MDQEELLTPIEVAEYLSPRRDRLVVVSRGHPARVQGRQVLAHSPQGAEVRVGGLGD
jgi:hypothetical protein